MSGKYVKTEQHGNTLLVIPLFTFASFAEADVSDEWKALDERLSAPDVKNVIVDLGQIPYFGSTVLEWMVQMWRRAKAKGGQLAACNCSPVGLEVLNAAHFGKLWGIFPTRSEALQSMNTGPI
jgi:anti-anti-sigma factor